MFSTRDELCAADKRDGILFCLFFRLLRSDGDDVTCGACTRVGVWGREKMDLNNGPGCFLDCALHSAQLGHQSKRHVTQWPVFFVPVQSNCTVGSIGPIWHPRSFFSRWKTLSFQQQPQQRFLSLVIHFARQCLQPYPMAWPRSDTLITAWTMCILCAAGFSPTAKPAANVSQTTVPSRTIRLAGMCASL